MYISQFLAPQLGIKPPHSPKFVCVHVSISWATVYISMSWATVYKTVNVYAFVSQFYIYIHVCISISESTTRDRALSCSVLQCVSVCVALCFFLSLSISLSLSLSLSFFLSRSLALSLSHSLFLPPLNTEVRQLLKCVSVHSKSTDIHSHMCDMPHSHVWRDAFICVT